MARSEAVRAAMERPYLESKATLDLVFHKFRTSRGRHFTNAKAALVDDGHISASEALRMSELKAEDLYKAHVALGNYHRENAH